MFEWMLPENHAIAILRKDHDTVKELFDKFKKAEKTAAKEKVIDQAVNDSFESLSRNPHDEVSEEMLHAALNEKLSLLKEFAEL